MAICLLALAPGALAQSGLPVDIAADTFELEQAKGRAVFAGNVEVTHGKVRLGAERLEVFYEIDDADTDTTPGMAPASAIDKIVATGGVTLLHGDDTATGDTATYTPNPGLVEMAGGVVLVRGGNVLKGDRLTFNMDTGHVEMHAPKNNGRVKASFGLPEGN